MSGFTASLDDAVTAYSWEPANFGPENEVTRICSADGFRAGAEWAAAHIDWRVLGGLIPGMVEARHVRLGDVVRLSGGISTVVAVRHHGTPGCVYVTARTGGGAEVIYELRTSERVRVDKAATS